MAVVLPIANPRPVTAIITYQLRRLSKNRTSQPDPLAGNVSPLGSTLRAGVLQPAVGNAGLTRLLRWLVAECSVQEICAAKDSWIVTSTEGRLLHKQAPSGVVIYRSHQELEEEPYTPLARVTIFDHLVTNAQIEMARLVRRPLHIVLYPFQAPDPDHLSRRLADTATNSARLEQLDATIHQ